MVRNASPTIFFQNTYRVVRQWWIVYLPETCRKPAGNPSLTDHTVPTYTLFFMSTIHKVIPVSITLLPPPPLTQLNSKKRREQKMFIMGSFHVTFVPPFHSMMKTTTNVYSSSQTSKEERMLWNTPLWTTNTYYYRTWNHLHPALTRCAVYVAVCFAWLAGKHHVLQLSNISS